MQQYGVYGAGRIHEIIFAELSTKKFQPAHVSVSIVIACSWIISTVSCFLLVLVLVLVLMLLLIYIFLIALRIYYDNANTANCLSK